MRNFLLASALFLFFSACSNEKKETTEKEVTTAEDPSVSISNTAPSGEITTASMLEVLKPYDKFLGSFVGPFGRNKITLLITKVTKDSVVGRTIVGGNDRPFYGTYNGGEGVYFFNAKEPGDHKDDGVFNWAMYDSSPEIINGGWEPYAKGRPGKEYQLQRKKFSYRTDVGDFPEASQRLLKPADVENMLREDLEFMRNEIFARHGFCFNRRHLRQQFEMQDWYVPNTVDIKGFLTDVEKKNIALIKRYEKYAEKYGDEYGR